MTHEAESDWLSFHLFYHADRDRALRDFVLPIVARLLIESAIDSFFFTRYDLGGPHIRLRMRLQPDTGPEGVSDALTQAAAAFLERHPSTVPIPADRIRSDNVALLISDPDETSDVVFPDNTLQPFVTRFEVDRYGGPDLLDHSLDFFALSSVHALHHLVVNVGQPPARTLARTLRLLMHQAWGFASNPDDFHTLLDYPAAYWGDSLSSFADEADHVFALRREELYRVLRAELAALRDGRREASADPASPPALSEAARRLARTLRGTDRDRWWRIETSQLHMTANRLGLRNPEEVYLGRLLRRTIGEIEEMDPAFWSGLWAARAEDDPATETLGELVGQALAWTVSQPPPPNGES